MFVVATAGHVDHGKSALVRALTGMEPDRWAEERRRGMTIDLGYAWTSLPAGPTLAFVDVPGHARFIGNMLAGLGPAPAVLFVVAADEGWRRQSGEHLAAVDALGLQHGLLAVTRSDLADPGPATAQAREQLQGSSLGDMEAVAVSGLTGEGVPQLAEALGRLTQRLPLPPAVADIRLWVDRAFSLRGAGTVVTGTLAAGTLRVGDRLELRGRAVTVRGLHSLGEARDSVTATARVAVNLRGVDVADVSRGDALLSLETWRRTETLDIRLTADPRSMAEQLVLHVGSTSVPAHLRPLGADTARLRLAVPLPLRAGDRALLRDPARQRVVAGVVVLDADPPRLRRRGAADLRGQALHAAGERLDLRTEVRRRGAVRGTDLQRLGLDTGTERGPEGVLRVGAWLVDADRWQEWSGTLLELVREHHQLHPLEPGVPAEQARRGLALPDAALLAPLARLAGLVEGAGRWSLPGSSVSLGPAEQAVQSIEKALREAPFSAPEAGELKGLDVGPRELAAAERAGRLLRLGGGVVLLPDAPARAAATLAGLDGDFTLSQARQALGTTRRVAVPLLEHLDRVGVTRRVDDTRRRVVRPPGGD